MLRYNANGNFYSIQKLLWFSLKMVEQISVSHSVVLAEIYHKQVNVEGGNFGNE